MYLLLNENNRLDAQKMFIFNIIRRPLAFFPQLITNSMMFMVSIKRIGEFLDSIEDPISTSTPIEPPLQSQLQKRFPLIDMQNCTFSWSSTNQASNNSSSSFKLNNISLKISDPKLYVIIGGIVSGKTSLLSAVLGQMNLVNKNQDNLFKVNGSIAYVPQNAWIQSGSIRDNILFGKKYNSKWYQKVVEACALEKDFQQLTGIIIIYHVLLKLNLNYYILF